ncbi:MAG: hypothetical protein VX519_00160 [Myxococcota bacterium]|nr:hypothetical protein [Myxococcota bacterium]
MLIRVAVFGALGLFVACSHGPWLRTSKTVILDCPEPTLSAKEIVELSQAGLATVEENMLGEHHSIAALDKGMPMLKQAALHGNLEAMSRYAGLVTWYGFIDNAGDRFLGRTQWENAQEGMLFTILAAHLGESYSDYDAATFRVLLDPAVAYPPGFFDDSSGTAWLLQGWPSHALDPIREQAYRWKSCWSE